MSTMVKFRAPMISEGRGMMKVSIVGGGCGRWGCVEGGVGMWEEEDGWFWRWEGFRHCKLVAGLVGVRFCCVHGLSC